MKKTINKEGLNPDTGTDAVAVMEQYIPATVTSISISPECCFLNVSITSLEEMVTVSEFETVQNDAEGDYFDLNLN